MRDNMSSINADEAEAVRKRLQADLRSAMEARAALEIAILRQLISASDNAGAVPLPTKTEPIQSEAERRSLGSDDIRCLLQREFEIRRHAAHQFSTLGRTVEAETANLEMDVVARLSADARTRNYGIVTRVAVWEGGAGCSQHRRSIAA